MNAIAEMKKAWIEFQSFLTSHGQNAGTAIGNAATNNSDIAEATNFATRNLGRALGAIFPGGGLSTDWILRGIQFPTNVDRSDISRTSSQQGALAQQASDRAAIAERDRQIAAIEARRNAAEARYANRPTTTAAQDLINAQHELQLALEEASFRRIDADNRRAEEVVAGVVDGKARGTFNRDALSGFSGNPMAKLEEKSQTQIDLLRVIRTDLANLVPRVS